MRMLLLSILACAMIAPPALAQNIDEQTRRASVKRRLQEKRQQLQRREADVERLTDLLVRFDLGIPVEMDRLQGLTDAERGSTRAELEKRVAESLDAVAEMSAKFERRRANLEVRRSAILAGAEPPEAADTAPTELTGGDPLPPHTPVVDSAKIEAELLAATPDETHAAPDSGSESPRPAHPALILGTVDHTKIGIAFYMSGQYEKAVLELERVDKQKGAPLLPLFYLARTYEKLGDIARADSTFLQIEALDEKREAGGGWASAARTARQQMNWMRDHGSWHPPALPTGK